MHQQYDFSLYDAGGDAAVLVARSILARAWFIAQYRSADVLMPWSEVHDAAMRIVEAGFTLECR